MLHRSIRWWATVAVVGGLAGCASDPVTTTGQDDESLAVALDGMTQEAERSGDPDASAAFGAAAVALRLGVRPSDLAVSVDGDVRRYQAFVHVVRRTRENRSIDLRTMVAIHRAEGRPAEILYLALPSDHAEFAHPASARPAAHGVSSWKDLGPPQFYLATRGFGEIIGVARRGPCPKVSPRGDVTCTLATFATRLEGVYHALIGNQRGQLSERTVEIRSRGEVGGAVLTF